MTMILPGNTIGMLGGGQLGRMFTFKAKQLGYNVITLDPDPTCPCGQVADAQLVAAYTDETALQQLGEQCAVITYEFENVSAQAIKTLAETSTPVFPSGNILHITQDRLREKNRMRALGLQTADFMEIATLGDLQRAATEIGFPAVLKTTQGGYDGKGQFVVKTTAESVGAFESTTALPLIWEAWVPFTKEVSLICARNQAGDCVTYPLTENIHVNNILDISLAPGRVTATVQAKADEIARCIAAGLGLVGVCGIELFLLPDETLLVNEIAPRPHNSGHYTIEACPCSQFEQQLRAVCGLPLGSTQLVSPAVMVNILGDGNSQTLNGLAKVLQHPTTHFHLYGKKEVRPKRKMGHLTVLANDVDMALNLALEARQALKWV